MYFPLCISKLMSQHFCWKISFTIDSTAMKHWKREISTTQWTNKGSCDNWSSFETVGKWNKHDSDEASEGHFFFPKINKMIEVHFFHLHWEIKCNLPCIHLICNWPCIHLYEVLHASRRLTCDPNKLEPQGALIAHLSTMSTSVIS